MINTFRLNIMLKSKHILYSIIFWVEGKINEKYYNFNFNTTDLTTLMLGIK
jgi:hypothetical protein